MPTDEKNLFQPEDDTQPQGVSPHVIEDETGYSGAPASLPPEEDTPYTVAPPVINSADTITWTASEYVTHHKTAEWYVLLSLAAALITVVTWLVTREIFPAAMVAISLVLLGIYAAHKPQELHYGIDAHGLTIGNQHHHFDEFRSFAIVPEGTFSCIELTPHKRFAMYTAIYYEPGDEDTIIKLLSTRLPMEDPKSNFADNLMRRIHF